MASPSPSPASRRGTPVSFPRPSAKLVRDGSVAPGQKAVNGNRARPQAWPVRPPPPRRVSTSNVSYVPTTPSTTPASSSASPLQRQALSRPGTGQGHQRRGSKRYSLPTALQSPNPSSPFSSSLEEDNDAAGSEYDDVESSFWASQHPRSSQGEEPITEVPSEGSDEDAQDLVTEVSDLDADIRLALDRVAHLHSSKLTDYKRLLSAATSQAAQHQLDQSSQHTPPPQQARPLHQSTSEGLPTFDISNISDYVYNLNMPQRLDLLDLVLRAVHGSDLWVMQQRLEHYRKSTRDVIGSLPPALAARILARLDADDLLPCRLVSKAWNDLISDSAQSSSPYIWRAQCMWLTRFDAVKPRPKHEGAWFQLYKGLHHLNRNWQLGRAQDITLLKGHTAHVTSLKKHGDTLITGSYDCTIRVWNLQTSKCLKTITCASSISCIDYLPEYGVVAAGCHAVGTIFILSSTSGQVLATLQGHNKGIKSVAISDKYIVSAGMDKALVVWSLETGKKIVRFGSQTNLSLGFSLFDHQLCAVQVDGLLRTFDIQKRQMLGQFRPFELFDGFPSLAQHYKSIANSTQANVFMWFASSGRNITIATRDHLLYFRWREDSPGKINLKKPPELLSYIVTDQRTNDLTVGVSDPDQARVLTSTRFATRTSASEHRIYVGHFTGNTKGSGQLAPIQGAWTQGAQDGSINLQTSSMNPMCLEVDRERLVVGTTGGLVYTVSFLGSSTS